MNKKKKSASIQKIVYNNMYNFPALKEISWEGDSKEVLSSFPEEVKEDIGFALFQLQKGDTPKNTRSMVSIGSGVFEIKESDERAWYRVIYISKIGRTIYVLHSFEKKTRKTEKVDLDVAKTRLANVKNRIAKEEKNEKQKKAKDK